MTPGNLEQQLENAAETEKLTLLVQLSESTSNDDPEQSFKYAEEAFALCADLPPSAAVLSVYVLLMRKVCAAGDFQRGEILTSEIKKVVEVMDTPRFWSTYYRVMGFFNGMQGNHQEALDYYTQNWEHISQTDEVLGQMSALINLGRAYTVLSDYPQAKKWFQQCADLAEEHGEILDASSYNNIGIAYMYTSDFAEALGFMLKALKQLESAPNVYMEATCQTNIGIIYGQMNNNAKALEYMRRGLELNIKINNPGQIANSLLNLGEVCMVERRLDEARDHLSEAVRILELLGDRWNMAHAVMKLAKLASTEGDSAGAIQYFQDALKLWDELKDLNGAAHCYINMAEHFIEGGKFKEGLEYYQKGLELTRQIEDRDLEYRAEEALAITLRKMNRFEDALHHFEKHMKIKDEVLNQRNKDRIAQLQTQFDTESKEREAEIYRLRNVELKAANDQIQASIRYAKKIQQAILPDPELMQNSIPDHFLIYKPRDIVSGDFYWITQLDDRVLVAVVDCTGHGVPGAIMSIVGHSALQQIVLEQHITSPHLILKELHRHVQNILRQDTSTASTSDGMDMTICSISPDWKQLTWSGAHQKLYHTSSGILDVHDGSRFSIGGRRRSPEPEFTTAEINIQSGDMLYLCTDGYRDQKGDSGKKLGGRMLREILQDCAGDDLKTQNMKLVQKWEIFRGSEQQLDDVTVLGIRIP